MRQILGVIRVAGPLAANILANKRPSSRCILLILHKLAAWTAECQKFGVSGLLVVVAGHSAGRICMKSLDQGRKVLSALALGGLALLQFNTAGAVPLNVTATVDDVCELGIMGDVAFGVLTPGGGANAAVNGSVEWRCSDGTSADIDINNGGNGNRTMDHATSVGVTLAYELWQDVGFSTEWSNAGSDRTVTGTGMGGGYTTETVFGRILSANIDAAEVGDYTDQVDVNINIIP